MRRILDWTVTILFAPVFTLVLLAYDVFLRVASLFGIRAVERVAVSLQRSLVRSYRVTGATLEMELSPAIEEGRSYLIVSNHQSMFDIPLFAWAFPTNNGKYVTKKQLGAWIPAVSTNLKLGQHPLIDRNDRTSAVREISSLGERVERGEVSAVIFPEGTRARFGEMKPFKPAGLKTLLETAPHAPILPCCLDNSWQLMRYGFRPVPAGVPLKFCALDPIERTAGEDIDELIAKIESRIRARLAELRGQASNIAESGS